jgi:hypothetical protein
MVATAATTIGSAIDYWVATLTALFAGDPTTLIIDGPMGGANIDQGNAIVCIGATEPDDGGDLNTGATGQQAWRTVGGTSRDETFDLLCFVYTQDGSALKTARDRCLATHAVIVAAVQADPSSGGLVATSTTVSNHNLQQEANSDGWTCLFTFGIAVRNVIR